MTEPEFKILLTAYGRPVYLSTPSQREAGAALVEARLATIQRSATSDVLTITPSGIQRLESLRPGKAAR